MLNIAMEWYIGKENGMELPFDEIPLVVYIWAACLLLKSEPRLPRRKQYPQRRI